MNQQNKKIVPLTSITKSFNVLIPRVFGVSNNKKTILIIMIKIFNG